ncbi:VIT family-domain-containing protein [Suillus paluster]|uniref:VIT family-domain-containing protein n=1 Tax=Suillus paluster TaxID=48578 RepID=UPI001B881271|nr:VIT family-domain-containing protein [Suillus paluster]KAG1750399.1 VIT family-domain-containing protein [Suillus paluster]
MTSESNSNDAVATKPPVWPLDASGTITPPLPAKCDRNDRQDGVCCKELKDEDDRTLVDPDVVRDVVIGLSDGLTVPFALAAGLSSLGTSRLVVVGGVAELIAGALSMGIGGFLASQSERDHYHFSRRQISTRVQRSCVGELEREVCAVLGPLGVDEQTCQAVTKCLRDVEYNPEVGASGSSSDEESQSLRWNNQVGLTPFLLRFGEGMEEISKRRVYISALTIGLGYLVGGIIPLIPYFFVPEAHVALVYSCVITGIVLLIFGAVKARVTGAGGDARGYIWGAVSTLFVGGTAAAAAYGLVALLEAS